MVEAPRLEHRQLPVAGLLGYFSWDVKKQTLTTHCQIDGHNRCHVNRTCTQNDSGLRRDQGRPVGSFLAWLAEVVKRPETHHDRDAHMGLGGKESEFHRHIRLEHRRSLRAMLLKDASMQDFWNQKFERPPRDGEEDEPLGTTY